MATQSRVFAWRISWKEEPGRLQSMRSQRVEHDLSDLAQWNIQESHKILYISYKKMM